jgi:hypothetical protein
MGLRLFFVIRNDIFANEKQKCGFATPLFHHMKYTFRITKNGRVDSDHLAQSAPGRRVEHRPQSKQPSEQGNPGPNGGAQDQH